MFKLIIAFKSRKFQHIFLQSICFCFRKWFIAVLLMCTIEYTSKLNSLKTLMHNNNPSTEQNSVISCPSFPTYLDQNQNITSISYCAPTIHVDRVHSTFFYCSLCLIIYSLPRAWMTLYHVIKIVTCTCHLL